MGSQNTDGTRISQTRMGTKNIGRAYIFSANGGESETFVEDKTVHLGTEPDASNAQRSVYSQGRSVVINDEDGVLVERVMEAAATGNPIDQNPPWLGAGALTWPLTVDDGLGAVPQLIGPSDEAFEINAGVGQTFRVEAGDKDGVVGWSFGGQIRMYAGYGTNGADGGILDFAGGNGVHGGDAFFYAGAGTTTPGSTFIDAGPGPGSADGTVFIGTYSGYTSEVVLGNTFSQVTASGVVKQFKPYLEVISLTNLQERTLAASSGSVIAVGGTGTRTIKLPANPSKSLRYDIKDADGTASSGNIAILPLGSKLIDGAASGVLDTNYESRTVIYNGTQWSNI